MGYRHYGQFILDNPGFILMSLVGLACIYGLWKLGVFFFNKDNQ